MVKMNSLFFTLFSVLFTGALMFSADFLHAAAPSWTAGTPKIVNGATSMDINVSLDQKGKVYFAVYKNAPASPTAASVKSDATGATSDNLVQNGVISVDVPNNFTYAYLKGMAENTTYTTLLIAENSTGELQNTNSLVQLTNIFPKRQAAYYYSTDLVPGTIVNYLAYFPEEYYRDSTRNFPFLIIFNGDGEKTWPATVVSNEMWKLLKYGPAKLIDQGKDFPFVVITPQTGFAGWDEYTVNTNGVETQLPFKGAFMANIVENMERRYHLDPSRLYISGLSLGGGATYSFFQQMPEKIAAAAPIAGWGNPTTACEAKGVGVWSFHNANDGTCPLVADEAVIDAINSCKPKTLAKLTIYNPGYGHGGWNETYENFSKGNVYDWFLTNVKSNETPEDGSNKSPLVYGGSDLTVPVNVGKVVLQGKADDSDGKIESYEWKQMSGPQDVVLENIQSPTVTLKNLSPGRYTFRLTAKDNGGRSAFDEIVLDVKGDAGEVITAVYSGLPLGTVSVNPNPVVDNIHVAFPQDISGMVNLTISDMQGRVLTSEPANASKGEVVMNYNMQQSNLPKGIYLLKVNSAGKNYVTKIIKD